MPEAWADVTTAVGLSMQKVGELVSGCHPCCWLNVHSRWSAPVATTNGDPCCGVCDSLGSEARAGGPRSTPPKLSQGPGGVLPLSHMPLSAPTAPSSSGAVVAASAVVAEGGPATMMPRTTNPNDAVRVLM